MARLLARSLPLLAAIALLVASPTGAQASTEARWADELVDSVGVNVHMGYNDTPYRLTGSVADRLEQLGVRHVRDGVMQGRQDQFRALNVLAERGIRSTLIMGDPAGRYGSLDRTLPDLRNHLLGAVEAVEGTNEYDNWSGDPNWAENLRAFQQRLYGSIKDDPRTAHLPVLAPSFVKWSSYGAFGDMTPYLDAGNLHPYPGGERPERPGHIEGELARAAVVSGAEPVIATETGYHNATATTNGHKPVSEAAAASYVQRLALTNFRKGISRSFLYELLDQFSEPGRTNPERHFGLLRNDLSPKPSFTALSNLLHLLEDPERPDGTAAGSLSYSWSGATNGLQDQLLRKADGSFWLVAWRGDSLYDTGARQELSSASSELTLELPDRLWTTEVYRPSAGREPVDIGLADDRVSVAVGSDPVLVRIARLSQLEPEPPLEEGQPPDEGEPMGEDPVVPGAPPPPLVPLPPPFPPQRSTQEPRQPPAPQPAPAPPADNGPSTRGGPGTDARRRVAASMRLLADRIAGRLRRPGRPALAATRRITVGVPATVRGRTTMKVTASASRRGRAARPILLGRTSVTRAGTAVIRVSPAARSLLRSRARLVFTVTVEHRAASGPRAASRKTFRIV